MYILKNLKQILLFSFLLLAFTCFSQQPKKGTRYFQITFIAIMKDNSTSYGTYYFKTENNFFPSKKYCDSLAIKENKLELRDKKSIISFITEFKNETEWSKWAKE